MRILYVHRTQGEEPESIHIKEIIDALRTQGHTVFAVGPVDIERASVAGRPSRLAAIKRLMPRFLFEWIQIVYNVRAYWQIYRACKAFSPDFIYERYALFGFVGVFISKLRKIPLILEVNTPYAHAWARYYGLRLKRIATFLERYVISNAGVVVTVTDVQRKFLIQNYAPIGNVVVSHNAIDPAKFSPNVKPDIAATNRLKKTGSEMVVGFVGTMNRWQGIPGFRFVVPAVLKRAPHVRFLFVGEGEYREELQRALETDGVSEFVYFTGRRAHRDVPALVSAMDVAVLLNSNDYGSPMKIFEYWAMGKAVIAPRVAPVQEVLRESETGLLIAPADHDSLTENIVLLARDQDLRERLGRTGRDYVLKNHTWTKNASQIMDEYSKLVASQKAAAQDRVLP